MMKNTEQIINLSAMIPERLAGKRLDQALAKLFSQFSRARLQEWIRGHQIKIDGYPKRPRDRVVGGEIITINAILSNETDWLPESIPLNIVYEDSCLLVINKPVGLVVHPAAGNLNHTLVNALLHHISELAKLPRAGIVHRLDKDTSGLLVVAKTLLAHTELTRQLQAHTMQREYLAVVTGPLISGGTIDVPIGRHPIHRKQMAAIELGKTAITHYRIVERYRAHTLLKVNLATGRTHQIRVHMAHIQHPIVGDPTYGGRLQIPKDASDALRKVLREFKHQALHAQRLGFIHPLTHEHLEWQAALPDDMQYLIETLREDKGLS